MDGNGTQFFENLPDSITANNETQGGAQTVVTFNLAGSPSTTATVTNGQFTDSFAHENTLHIYQVNSSPQELNP